MSKNMLILLLTLALGACSSSATNNDVNLDMDPEMEQPDQAQDMTEDQSPDAERDADMARVPDADAGPDQSPDADQDSCVCQEVNTCCDGCQPRLDGQRCDDGDETTFDSVCQADGSCGGGKMCPCDDASDPCCDGCKFEVQGTMCEVLEENSGDVGCTPGCGGARVFNQRQRTCSGSSAMCDGAEQEVEVMESCGAQMRCQERMSGETVCVQGGC